MIVHPGRIALIIPAHNEAERLNDVLANARLEGGARIVIIVVVDDGSTDDTRKIALGHTRHVVSLDPVRREDGTMGGNGNGVATRAALRYLREISGEVPFDAVMRIDGDGQHLPSFIPKVIQRFDDGADIVVCSRFDPNSDTRAVMTDRYCLNEMVARMVRKGTGWRVTDARSGFFIVRWSAIVPIIEHLKTVYYGVPIELLLRLWHSNKLLRYEEVDHPAIYNAGTSERLDAKYAAERVEDRIQRVTDAVTVLFRLLDELRIGVWQGNGQGAGQTYELTPYPSLCEGDDTAH